MTQKAYPGVPKFSGTPIDDADDVKVWTRATEQWIRQSTSVLNNMLIGKLNVSDTLTLSANTTTTVVTDARCSYQSAVVLSPTTSNAAAAVGTTYISETGRVNGSFTLTHANNAQTDRVFRYALIG